MDSRPLLNPGHAHSYVEVDLLEPAKLAEIVNSFAPTHVVHLAARTDLVEGRRDLEYAANTAGSGIWWSPSVAPRR